MRGNTGAASGGVAAIGAAAVGGKQTELEGQRALTMRLRLVDGVTRDQMMARHQSNHIQVVYAPDESQAQRGARIKAAALDELGLEVHLCGDVPVA